MLRKRKLPALDAFPPDPWSLAVVKPEPEISPDQIGQTETMFSLSNGYLGMRGTMDEGTPILEPGTFLNGFYAYRPLTYGEKAYGFPETGQSMITCPDGLPIRLQVDGEAFDLATCDLLDFERRLDLRAGLLHRRVEWRSGSGKRVQLRTTRLVSFADRHLAAIDWQLQLLDGGQADIVIVSDFVERHDRQPSSDFDPRLSDKVENPIEFLEARRSQARSTFLYRTHESGLVLACGVDHRLDTSIPVEAGRDREGEAIIFRFQAQQDETVRLAKYLAYRYEPDSEREAMFSWIGATLDGARSKGFDAICRQQQEDLAEFWSNADIKVNCSDRRLQQIVRWNLFQLHQASARADGQSVGVRGLTGRTYEGHYFWDTEIYVLPFLVYTNPEAARNVLHFRYRTLDKARERAAELGHKGATFPWRTINGAEASAYYPAGTAQYHINADIAYAIRKYVDVTGDLDFLHRHGAEILVETARFWFDLGFFSARRNGKFCINGVTGPDEYTTVVNNNHFTNLMASENMAYAARVVEEMERESAEAFEMLAGRTGLKKEEVADWRRAAENIHLPYDDGLKIHPQDDNFLDKEPWDFANTPPERYPLLLHYHPLNLYRSQIIKQADTVLVMFLLSDRFSDEAKKRNFDYYDPITTHDSSLSVCIQSIIANEVGYRQRALEYFRFAAAMDLSDIGGNMKHGAHIAAIGGTWMALVYGFGGFRDDRGQLSFRPMLPSSWTCLHFCLKVRGCQLCVEIDHQWTLYRLVDGNDLALRHAGEEVKLTAMDPERRCPTPQPGNADEAFAAGPQSFCATEA